MWGPFTIAKLVQITTTTKVYGCYNYSFCHWIGLWENLQETLIFHGENDGFL